MTECVICPEGYYCEPSGQTKFEDKPCPAGHYCPKGTGYRFAHPCSIGHYRNGSAGVSDQDCSVCFAGKYCPERGMAYPLDCPRVSMMKLCPMTLGLIFP